METNNPMWGTTSSLTISKDNKTTDTIFPHSDLSYWYLRFSDKLLEKHFCSLSLV